MHRKIILLLVSLFTFLTAYAGFNDILIANVQYDWINKSMMEKEAIISEVHDIIFDNPIDPKLDIKGMFADKLKDKNHLENYYAASAGYKEYKDKNIGAFYYKRMKNLYMYAIQEKQDVSKSFYYDALGKLRYVDFISGEYPDYPYTAIQYSINGKPVSAIYYVSKDCQYLFTPEGKFEGVWYKYKLYNDKSKVILKRTSY